MPAAKLAGRLTPASIKIPLLVLGAGPIGMITALVARNAGANWVAITDLIDEPLRRIADLGADETIAESPACCD